MVRASTSIYSDWNSTRQLTQWGRILLEEMSLSWSVLHPVWNAGACVDTVTSRKNRP